LIALHPDPQHSRNLFEGHTMSFLWAIIAGLIIGLIARAILPGRQNIPIWLTIILGVIGAIIGNLIASALGVRDTGGIDWIRHIIQIAAAAGLIAVVAPLWAKRAHR
jgi:uncharacterized membrane protein YeaQ/YmgE (transglycosylase-associated protein family)